MNELIAEIESMEREGAVVLLKWDGERGDFRRTVVISRADTDYLFRKDSEDIQGALREGIGDYREVHPLK